MGDKKETKREKLKKEFLDKLEKLRQRVDKTRKREELRDIRHEILSLAEELEKKDKKAWEQVRRNWGELDDLVDSRTEYLGGSPAPFHIG